MDGTGGRRLLCRRLAITARLPLHLCRAGGAGQRRPQQGGPEGAVCDAHWQGAQVRQETVAAAVDSGASRRHGTSRATCFLALFCPLNPQIVEFDTPQGSEPVCQRASLPVHTWSQDKVRRRGHSHNPREYRGRVHRHRARGERARMRGRRRGRETLGMIGARTMGSVEAARSITGLTFCRPPPLPPYRSLAGRARRRREPQGHHAHRLAAHRRVRL